jgi:uncharacterized peroxidase-related enzyme
MSRLRIPTRDDAPLASRELLDEIHDQLGVVPSFYRLLASSPAALRGYTAFSGALAGVLDVKVRERIALALAQENGCDYCLSAHTYRATNLAKISPDEIELSRRCRSSNAKAEAAMKFAVLVMRARGNVLDLDIADIRQAGFSDPEIVEIVAHVCLNVFTNSLNHVAQTEIDFPLVRSAQLA